MTKVNPEYNPVPTSKVQPEEIPSTEKTGGVSTGYFQKFKEAISKTYDSLRGRVSVEITGADGKVEGVFKKSLSSLGITKKEYSQLQKQGVAKDVIKHAAEGNASILRKNFSGQVIAAKRIDLQGLGLTREEFLKAKKAGKAVELIQSAQEAHKLAGADADTVKKAIQVSDEHFALALQEQVTDEIRIHPGKEDVWVRKIDHKVEVWTRAKVEDSGFIAKIQKVGGQAIAFAKNTAFLQKNAGLDDSRREKELTQKFTSVGVDLEGSVTVTGTDDAGYRADMPEAGFVIEAGKSVYSDRCEESPTLEELDKEGKELTKLLDKMHKFGTHNDIKPENIVEREDGSLRFIDFGGASLNGDKEALPALECSVRYIREEDRKQLVALNNQSPKDVKAFDRLRKAIDIHQMGVALYLRAKGEGVVEDGGFPYEFAKNGLPGELKEPLFTAEDKVSPKMQNLIRSMLIENPEERAKAYNKAKKKL